MYTFNLKDNVCLTFMSFVFLFSCFHVFLVSIQEGEGVFATTVFSQTHCFLAFREHVCVKLLRVWYESMKCQYENDVCGKAFAHVDKNT